MNIIFKRIKNSLDKFVLTIIKMFAEATTPQIFAVDPALA